jgi:hypothetical protein
MNNHTDPENLHPNFIYLLEQDKQSLAFIRERLTFALNAFVIQIAIRDLAIKLSDPRHLGEKNGNPSAANAIEGHDLKSTSREGDRI